MSDHPPLRGALIGCGTIAGYHLQGWRRIPGVEVVAFADPRGEAARQRRDEFYPGGRIYEDVAAMLAAETLDFVDVLSPPERHAEHCLLARERGLHVICQKPLTGDLASARRLVEAMRSSARLFAVHENHRYRPWFQAILAHHREGFFGTLSLVRIDQLDAREPAEAFKVGAPRGVLLEYGTHLVDLMRALLGEPRRVFARAHRPNPRVAAESLVHATYDCGPATGIVEAGWKAHGLPMSRLLVLGDRGEALYEGTMTRGGTSRFRLLRGAEVLVDEQRSPDRDYADSFYRFEAECAAAMRTGAAVAQTGDENLRTLAATFAAYSSCEEARLVHLSESAFAARPMTLEQQQGALP